MAKGDRITNHGGPVIGSVEVTPIYWGNKWSVAPNVQLANQLDQFIGFLVASSLMDTLVEYGTNGTAIGHGSRSSSVRINSEPGDGTTVTDGGVQQVLQSWIAVGKVPAVTPNTLYIVFLPPGVTSSDQNDSLSCTNMCSYHNAISNKVFYAVIAYVDCPLCRLPGALLDSFTSVISHELVEVVTDPTLSTWYETQSGNEIADACQPQTARIGGYLVQPVWSNSRKSCVAGPPTPLT